MVVAGAASVSEGRVIMVVIGPSSVVVGGGGGVGVVVGVVEVVRDVEVEVKDALVVEGVFVAGVRVRDVRMPAPKMSLVRLSIPDPIGTRISENSDWIGAARLLGRAENRMSSAFVGAALDSEGEVACPTAARRPPSPSAVLVAPVMFAGSGSRFMVLLSVMEVFGACAAIT